MLRTSILFAAVAALLAFAAPASAADPAVTTGTVADLTPTTATALGVVNPRDASGVARAQFGTAPNVRKNGTGVKVRGGEQEVRLPMTGLRPSTKYFYRVTIRTKAGTFAGKVRDFRTPAPPSVGTLTVTPNPVPFGQSVRVSGALAGNGNGGSKVVLEGTPHPFNQPFAPLMESTAGGDGSFSFSTTVQRRTRVQVRATPPSGELVSPLAGISVRPILRNTSSTRSKSGRLTFRGTIAPGGAYSVSIRKDGQAVKFARSTSSNGTTRYRISVRNTRRTSQYALRVAKLDRSLVSYTTTARFPRDFR